MKTNTTFQTTRASHHSRLLDQIISCSKYWIFLQRYSLLTLNKKLSNQLGSMPHVESGYLQLIALFVTIILCRKYSTALLNVYRVLYRTSCRLKIARSVKLVVKTYLYILKEHAKTKRKTIASLSRNSHLKRMVFEQFDEHLPHFQFKSDFLSYCNSLCQEFENFYTLVTINKTYKYPKGETASSQTYQDDINLTEVLTREKSNDLLQSTENRSESGT